MLFIYLMANGNLLINLNKISTEILSISSWDLSLLKSQSNDSRDMSCYLKYKK